VPVTKKAKKEEGKNIHYKLIQLTMFIAKIDNEKADETVEMKDF
jgi:hypothetical protein